MTILVVYDSRFGNTRLVAEAAGRALEPTGDVHVCDVGTVTPDDLDSADLLLAGGPTHWFGMSSGMRRFCRALPDGRGRRAAAFDTRYPSRHAGSAARRIARDLERHGFTLAAPPESFLVTEGQPRLLPGEIDRVLEWAGRLAASSAVVAA